MSDDELLEAWNRLWLISNEAAQAELFQQETLPQDFRERLQKLAPRKTIVAFSVFVKGE